MNPITLGDIKRYLGDNITHIDEYLSVIGKFLKKIENSNEALHFFSSRL